MTAVAGMVGPKVRAFLEVFAVAAPLGFVVVFLGPAYEFAVDEIPISTPALDISNGWRAAAPPTGGALMILVALLRLVRTASVPPVVAAFALAAALGGALYAISPLMPDLGNLNFRVFFVGVVSVGVFAGVPIALSFGLATVGYLSLTTSVPMPVVVGRMDEGMSHFILLSVPLFVFLGLLIEMTAWRARWSRSWATCSGTCAAGSRTCSSDRCTWCPASPDRRRPTWRQWRPSSSPACRRAARRRANWSRGSRPPVRRPRRFRRASC